MSVWFLNCSVFSIFPFVEVTFSVVYSRLSSSFVWVVFKCLKIMKRKIEGEWEEKKENYSRSGNGRQHISFKKQQKMPNQNPRRKQSLTSRSRFFPCARQTISLWSSSTKRTKIECVTQFNLGDVRNHLYFSNHYQTFIRERKRFEFLRTKQFHFNANKSMTMTTTT